MKIYDDKILAELKRALDRQENEILTTSNVINRRKSSGILSPG